MSIPQHKLANLGSLDAGNMLVCIDADNTSHDIQATPQECIDWIRQYELIEKILAFVSRKPERGKHDIRKRPHEGGRKRDRQMGSVHATNPNLTWSATALRDAGATVIAEEVRIVEGRRKDTVDLALATEVLVRCLNSRIDKTRREIDSVLLLSGDGDFKVVLRALRSLHFKTIVAAMEDHLSNLLLREADHVILLDRTFDEKYRPRILPSAPAIPSSIAAPIHQPAPVRPAADVEGPPNEHALLLEAASLLLASPRGFAQKHAIADASALDLRGQLMNLFKGIVLKDKH